ncbi:SH3 domain-binding protein 5-like [Lamellibrachia satsuma]|nr:SH3 domain-binding protein 5-like [Lamellibrachia satsuma]
MASEEECSDVCVFEIEEEEEELDPRIEDYLEILNNTSQEINLLESELDRARNQFRNLLGKSTQKLNASYEKLGKCVPKARPYYILLAESKEAQTEAHKAAVQFQRANSVYQVAKETVGLAEERVTNDGGRKDFDAAWQEMLNHATKRFTESEEEKARSEEVHMAKAMAYATTKQKLDAIEKNMPKSIAKAKSYFDLKDRLEYALKQERQNIEDLQRALSLAKQKYKATLQSLETISESIHEKRKAKASSQLPLRTPGVGAESIYSQSSDTSDLPSINLDIISETSSGIYLDDDSVSMGDRSSVSRTPSGCSLASRTPGVGTSYEPMWPTGGGTLCESVGPPGVGTSCEAVGPSGSGSSAVCGDKTLVEDRLECSTIMDVLVSESDSLQKPGENLSQVCVEDSVINNQNAETTPRVEPVATGIGDLDLSQHASHETVNFDLSGQPQMKDCMQNLEGCDASPDTVYSSPVEAGGVENGHELSMNEVDDASGIDDIDSTVVSSLEVQTPKAEEKLQENNDGFVKESHQVVNGHNSDDLVKEATQLPQLPRPRKPRGAQFPILVGLSNCSRQQATPLGPAPLAFYPPIPQPPQAVTLAQNSRAQNNLLPTDQSLDLDDRRSDKNNTEVEVFV